MKVLSDFLNVATDSDWRIERGKLFQNPGAATISAVTISFIPGL